MTPINQKRAKIVRAALRGINSGGKFNTEITCEGETLANYDATESDKIAAALSVDEFNLETVNLYTGKASFAYFTWCNDLCESLVDYGTSLETELTQARAVCTSFE